MNPPILVLIDLNEESRAVRAKKIKEAVKKDDRFLLCETTEKLPLDLQFRLDDQTMNVELKDFTGDHQSDFLASLEGHLYEQILTARELGDPVAIVVLGGDPEFAQAAAKSAFSRGFRGKAAVDKIFEYSSMADGFEANCVGLNIPVWHFSDNPYKRLLSRVRKILQGGDLTGFRPAPAEGERKAVGLSMLIGNGIGPAKATSILEKFRIVLEPIQEDTYLNDCEGIGPKLAELAGRSMEVPTDLIFRPKERKARTGKAKAK